MYSGSERVRLARLGGHESAFGREFDSLADIVSFGVAPALMVYRVVLQEFPRASWIIASIYLACGALRLARYNCVSAEQTGPAAVEEAKNFTGFPITAAAGMIASITLFMLWLAEGDLSRHDVGIKLNDILLSALARSESDTYGKPLDAFEALVRSTEP